MLRLWTMVSNYWRYGLVTNRIWNGVPGASIWAEVNPYDAISTHFRSSRTLGPSWAVTIFLVIIALGVILGVAIYLRKQREGTPFRNPRRLWGDLCRLHQLDRPQRSLLMQVARAHQLDDPAELFIEPRYLCAERLSADFKKQAAQIDVLRKRLFEGSVA